MRWLGNRTRGLDLRWWGASLHARRGEAETFQIHNKPPGQFRFSVFLSRLSAHAERRAPPASARPVFRASVRRLCYTFRVPNTPVPLAVEIVALTRRFGAVEALREVSLEIRRGEYFSLLGPSGCGKTTLLRIIAGLDFPDDGALRLHGRDALSIPAHQRAVNTVFQSYALFPHLTVYENVAFGLRMRKVPSAELETRVRGVMELVRITDLAARRPSEISGGQKQRVALARALVNEPQVLLLDEPLGALDLKLRKELQQELRALQRRTGLTFIHVTHDQDEALGLSDRIAVMNAGRVVQLGTGEELYERPRTRFVAQFLGGCNLIEATVHRRNGNEVVVKTSIGELHLNTRDPRSGFTLAIRPEKIVLRPADWAVNQFRAIITETTYTGAETQCTLSVAEQTLRVATVNSASTRSGQEGESLAIALPPETLIVLED